MIFTETNPLDYVYKAIKCHIEPLEEQSVEAQYILKYISSSCKYTLKHFCNDISASPMK